MATLAGGNMSEKTPFIREYRKFYAEKSLGQHFLTNKFIADKMVEAADINKGDTILEIGPGLGILTQSIISFSAKTIILCEKDEKFVSYLKEKISDKRVKIIEQDSLLLIPNLQVSSPLKVISNLPYNISSPVITSLLMVCPTLPERIIVMLQKEVAQRLVSRPSHRERGILTVLTELFGQARIIDKVSKNQFYPAPRVDSNVLMISDIKKPDLDSKLFLKMLKFSFAGKRKKIKNSLFSTLKVSATPASKIAASAGISLDQRPEELTIEQWKKLFRLLKDQL